MLVGKIRNLFVESPLWLLGWNHHHSWLSQNTNCHESHIQKSIQKSIQNTNLIKSRFWDQNIDHSWDDPRGGFSSPMDFLSPTRRTFPDLADLANLPSFCGGPAGECRGHGKIRGPGASHLHLGRGGFGGLTGQFLGKIQEPWWETLDVRIWGGDCDFPIGQCTRTRKSLGLLVFFWWPLKQI